MADYKAIRGLTIRTIAGDASPIVIGDIWYNSSSRKIKGAKIVAGSWATGGNMNTARVTLAGAGKGTQTAGLVFGGYTPAPAVSALNESYDGSSWTEEADLNTAREALSGAGTQAAGLAVAGYISSDSALTEKWNGTSWTEVGDLNTARRYGAAAGTNTAALMFGGLNPVRALCEKWDGSSWTEVGDLNTARGYLMGGCGTNTAA